MTGWRPHDWLACALILALGLLERSAPAGLIPFVGAALVLLLGGVQPPPRRSRAQGASWRELAPVAALVVAGATALLELVSAAGVQAPSPLVTLARLGCVAGAASLAHTPPRRLAFHVLPVVVALWTATAVAPDPGAPVVALTLATLVSAAQALAATHARALLAEAESSLVTGLPPGSREARTSLLPALAVAALAAAPLVLGLRLPRPAERLATPAARRRGSVPRSPDARRVAFEPELDLAAARLGLEDDASIVARVGVQPLPAALLLRGAALDVARADGFFPRPRPGPAVEIWQPYRRTLEVEQRSPQRGYLFSVGQVLAFQGLQARPLPGGQGAPPGATYPLRYTVECAQVHPRYFLGGLRPLEDPLLLSLPAGGPRAELRALALQAVRGEEDPYRRARLLERWLHQRCAYDPGQPRPGGDLLVVVDDFLRRTRRGVCVEFAASMAVLLRLLGTPARVVTGYHCEERDALGRFVVRARQAHAWVEVPLEGGGWVPFDPTPGVPAADAAQADATQPPAAPAGGEAAAPAAQTPQASPGPSPPLPWPLALTALSAVTLALLGAGLRARRRLRRELLLDVLEGSAPPPALRGLRERLFALLVSRGYRLGQSETPLAFVARVTPAGDPLRRAVACYTELRFSGRSPAALHEALRRALAQAR